MKRTLTALSLLTIPFAAQAWDHSNPYSRGSERHYDHYAVQPSDRTRARDSRITPHVWGGGYTESFDGGGVITVSPDGLGGWNVFRDGNVPYGR